MTTPVGRVVLSKVGLDGHEVGVRIVAKTLITAGFEVVYLGKRVSTEQIVSVAVAEDADVIGVSCLSGGLGHFSTALLQHLASEDLDIPVIAGGIDEPAEIENMLGAGVYRYFGPDSDETQIVESFRSAVHTATVV